MELDTAMSPSPATKAQAAGEIRVKHACVTDAVSM